MLTFTVIAGQNARAFAPCIDGRPLCSLVERFERASDYADPAGGYGGLVPDHFNFGPLAAYFMGEAAIVGEAAGEIYTLGCECGEVGCWPLLTSVSVAERIVRWSGFRQPFRPERDYAGFGPFVFDRQAYREAVAQLESRFSTDPG